MWTCVSTAPGKIPNASSLCRGVVIPSPGVCVDDGEFTDNTRTREQFDVQEQQCDTAKGRLSTCPNDPSMCSSLNKTTFCGGSDQQCLPHSGKHKQTCLPLCWTDCYPCNDESDCSMLVGFGILAAKDAPCYSLQATAVAGRVTRNVLPNVYVRQWLMAKRTSGSLQRPVSVTDWRSRH